MSQLDLSAAPALRGRRHRPAASERPLRGRLRAVVRGRAEDPVWARAALFGVLALAAVLCLWNLMANGMSNEYYAAAVKSASVSLKAWFFGSLDPGSFITVDKPPLALWLGGLSARVFGFSSFSILLPQALCSVAAVGVLYAAVKRAAGPAAGTIAAALLAVTPVSVAIARVNNPDALLVLLMVVSAYLLVRAVQSGRTKPLVWCGVVVGLAFMTKMLQGWMVAPALFATYLFAGPPALGTRIRQLTLAGAAMLATSAAWPLAVTLWPGSKPYIGGSTDGSVWNLILGYNGLGRITGASEGGGGGGIGASFGGVPGLWRMFNAQVGGQVGWLIPLAGVALVAGLWKTRRAGRTDVTRASFVLFGLWALVHIAIFSTQKGIFHPYYVSALAPALAALAGMGLVVLARAARTSWAAHAVLAASVLGTAYLAVDLLGRTADFAPALRVVIPVAAVVAVVASVGLRLDGARGRQLIAVAAVAGAVAVAAGPAAYSVATAGRSLSGNNVLAGPASAGMGGMGGGPGGGGFGGGSGARPTQGGAPGGTPPTQSGASGSRPAFTGGPPSGTASRGMPGGGGGSVSDELVSYLQAHQGDAKYLVAASGSQTTAGIIIATGQPVITIGGFSGSDPAPTVSQLAKLVVDGDLRYVLVGPGGGPGGGDSDAIATWVKAHGKAVSGVSSTSGTLYRVSA